jgi:thioester reductase-like protein
LVGRYLLRDWMIARAPVAVLVRPEKLLSAQQRIEAVMHHWETQQGRSLVRPVVLQGDLAQPGLGLDEQQRRWVSHNCDTILHSAASMAFRPDDRGEPWQTNVEGMGHLIEVCRETGIRKFHHISTAYLCGLRTGRILESEVDVGQTLGNVYEDSKLKAEKLLRAADGFDQVTFYRPASIVGDSQTGYSTNYHGFYLPLQLAYSFSGRIPPRQMNERFFQLLGLTGDEGKNFVPVDWLARAILYVFDHPEHHGQTYHLTSPQPVTVRLFQRVVQDALERYSKRTTATEADPRDLAVFEKLYYEQMTIYQSHWRDDPTFDRTNTDRVLGHLPCPAMDYDLLMRVARYPIETNFTLRRHAPVIPPIDASAHLAPLVDAAHRRAELNAAGESIGLEVSGCGGGQWHLVVHEGALVGAAPGLGVRDVAHYYLNSDTLAALARGELTVEQSIQAGRVVLEGPPSLHRDLMGFLEKVVHPA